MVVAGDAEDDKRTEKNETIPSVKEDEELYYVNRLTMLFYIYFIA